MELEFDDGGCVEMATGADARTTLELFRAHPEQVRISLDARASHGEMSLGVGLTADQARTVGHHLIALADELEDESGTDLKSDDDSDADNSDVTRSSGSLSSTDDTLDGEGVNSGYGDES